MVTLIALSLFCGLLTAETSYLDEVKKILLQILQLCIFYTCLELSIQVPSLDDCY